MKPIKEMTPEELRAYRKMIHDHHLKKRMAKGICIHCPNKRHPESTAMCAKCLKKNRLRQRQKIGAKAWRDGKGYIAHMRKS